MMTSQTLAIAAKSGNGPTFSSHRPLTSRLFSDDPEHDWQAAFTAALSGSLHTFTVGATPLLLSAHGGAYPMPIRLLPLADQRLPGVLPQAVPAPSLATPTPPAMPLWLSLLSGISLWLNRLFLGLVMALVGFTLWQWWQG
ncbi:hypothetical protein SB8_08020 [Pseudomonas oryzihabitans]|nr:hypothetical protein SB8_08020 [Pseudomonas psychrotolerans]